MRDLTRRERDIIKEALYLFISTTEDCLEGLLIPTNLEEITILEEDLKIATELRQLFKEII